MVRIAFALAMVAACSSDAKRTPSGASTVETGKTDLAGSSHEDVGRAVVQVTAMAGGVDANDWVSTLKRMLVSYCDAKGWVVDSIDEQPAQSGLQSTTFAVTGADAFRLLKTEHGIHRLVLISPH